MIPPGTIAPFAGTVAPAGWLFCDGSYVSQTTYAALFAAIGNAWQIGNPGTGNFQLPDLRQTSLRGWMPGTGTGETAVGGQGGNDSQTLTVANLPPHTHPYLYPSTIAAAGFQGGSTYNLQATAGNVTGSIGSGTAFDNRPNFKCVSFIIKT